MANNLCLINGIMNRKGEVVKCVQGGVKVFLGNHYNTDSPIKANTVEGTHPVTGATIQRTVCNIRGQLKADEFIAKQVKYFFDQDIPVGDFLNFNISLWGKSAENFEHIAPKAGEMCIFYASNVYAETFTRRNGSTGFNLNVQAFGFDLVRNNGDAGKGKADGEKAAAGKNKPKATGTKSAPAAPAASYPQQSDMEDFAAIEETDDLPF